MKNSDIKNVTSEKNIRCVMTSLLISLFIFSVTIVGAEGLIINFDVIERPSITVVSPNGGENLLTGTTHTIRWSSTGDPVSNVGIELFEAGVLSRTITVSTENDGSKSWTIQPTQALGTDYKIKITNLSNMADYDFSDNYFVIRGPSITVTSPNGGENWARGTTHIIKWDRTGNTGKPVKIELFRGDKLSLTISSETSNDGSYRWIVPLSQTLDSNYKIKITSNFGYYDWSNNYFRIS